jgi:hypothetical protein
LTTDSGLPSGAYSRRVYSFSRLHTYFSSTMSSFEILEHSRSDPSFEHPRKDDSLQKRKQGDDDDGNGPKKKYRYEEEDDGTSKKKATTTLESKLEYTKGAYQ